MEDYLISVTQKILDKEFSHGERRRIVPHHGRINFCCPYCGDSHNNPRNKRGNIYFNKLKYVCFNCGKTTTFDTFSKDFDQQLDPDKKLEIIRHLESNVTYQDYGSDFLDTKLDDLVKMDVLVKVCNENPDLPIYDLTPVRKGSGIDKYLTGRGITPELRTNIWQAKARKRGGLYEHVIVLLNRRGDDVLGIQVRNLKSGKRRSFNVYNYENLIKWTRGEEHGLDSHKIVLYTKLSYFFNIMNIDVGRPVTLFEGYIDSLFFPNSIGVTGVNTDLTFLETSGIDLRYFYDNDNEGNKKSLEKLDKGYQVFLWGKLFEHLLNTKKPGDPYSYISRIRKIKDLNKLAELIPDPYKKLKLIGFFSTDELDRNYLPRIVKPNAPEKDYNFHISQVFGDI
jgi:hypothetical protein